MTDTRFLFRFVRRTSLVLLPLGIVVLSAACDGDDGARANAGTCGNGFLEPNEECEGFDLRGQTCDTLGLSAVGVLKCNAQCKLDSSGCGGLCGDGVIGSSEACDGANLNGSTCASLFGEGTQGNLTCASDCKSFNTDACLPTAPPQGAFTACVIGAANTCPAPTTCVATATGSFCIESCDIASTAAPCGAGRYCEDVGAGAGACANVPKTGQGCTTRSGCVDAGTTCIPTFTNAAGQTISTCAVSCPAGEVGTGRASCTAPNTSCVAVANGPIEVEKPTACTAATEATDCNVAQGYKCKETVVVGGASAFRCIRPYGQCAPITPLYKFDNSPITNDYLCDRTEPTRGASKCGLASTAPLTNPARVECAEHFLGQPEVGVCVAFCDGAILGPSAAGGPSPDGACGDGAACGVPTVPEHFLPQADTAVPCTATSMTACTPGFDQCLDLGRGLECARAAKICVPN